MMWQPIETAPKDRFLLLCGPSGYIIIPWVFVTGCMYSDYHVGRWVDHANDDLSDWGFEPTHWMPLPEAPDAQTQPAPSVPREAIEKMLTQLMDIAVSNGANSISMPDEYVEVAAWLCGIPAQPAPSVPDADELAHFIRRIDGAHDLGASALAEKIVDWLAAAPEAKP